MGAVAFESGSTDILAPIRERREWREAQIKQARESVLDLLKQENRPLSIGEIVHTISESNDLDTTIVKMAVFQLEAGNKIKAVRPGTFTRHRGKVARAPS